MKALDMGEIDYKGSWDRDGYIVLRNAVPPAMGEAMLDYVTRLVREHQPGSPEVLTVMAPDGSPVHVARGSIIIPEKKPNAHAAHPEDHISKVFNLHRREAFKRFAESPAIVNVLEQIMGPDIDCFQSQFIFKNAGAWGQPWHQDSYYMPLDKLPQVGVWLALTEATPENGCLYVLPGSHREPIHETVPDRRPDANYGYVEIVDCDFSAAVPVLMSPGDVLIFHSFLMHRSTDNRSSGRRAAAMLHYARAGTRKTRDVAIYTFDFMPVRRGVE
jgi:phytanoyl-CoA hydroxylase